MPTAVEDTSQVHADAAGDCRVEEPAVQVYDDRALTCESTSAASEFYKAARATCSVEISLDRGKN